MSYYDSLEYHHYLIRKYYGDRVAERSGVPLINHVNEGLTILTMMNAPGSTMSAWCIHPIFQNDEDLKANLRLIQECERSAILETMEYRRCANSYLCRPETDDYTLEDVSREVNIVLDSTRMMLIADKVQNRKDFLKYHHGIHERSDQLDAYFKMWLKYLNVSDEDYDDFVSKLP